MRRPTLICPKCEVQVLGEITPETEVARGTCTACAMELEGYYFPAAFDDDVAATEAALILDDSEAGCFYHPQKRAVKSARVVEDSCVASVQSNFMASTIARIVFPQAQRRGRSFLWKINACAMTGSP